MAYKLIPYEDLRAFCLRSFCAYGFTLEESGLITDVLLQADLYGIESHGVQRFVRYHREITTGLVDVAARPETVYETPLSAVIDAHDMMGQLAAHHAMDMAIHKAETSGIGMVSVRNSNHYGIAGFYAEMALAHDLMGICMTNSEAIMVPTFGSKAMLGSNPIALSMPADPVPFLFDAATTVVPRGKLEVYHKQGKPVPNGWVLNADGRETADAGLVLASITAKLGGGILPLGGFGEETSGHKGYGFGLICELFTSIMSGGTTSDEIYQRPSGSGIAQCFMAVDYGLFGNKQKIKQDFSAYLQKLREAPKAEGQSRIYTHGEKEWESRKEKLDQGIPVQEKTLNEIGNIARELQVQGLM